MSSSVARVEWGSCLGWARFNQPRLDFTQPRLYFNQRYLDFNQPRVFPRLIGSNRFEPVRNRFNVVNMVRFNLVRFKNCWFSSVQVQGVLFGSVHRTAPTPSSCQRTS